MTDPEKVKFEVTKRRQLLITLVAIFALAFAIRQVRVQDGMGGYHSFNEAWYSSIAMNFDDQGSAILPLTVFNSVDYNVSPFFSYLLYIAGKLFGFNVIAFRLVPIFFSSITIFLLYALGARFFSSAAGVIAAALYAFVPVSVIVGRNIQTDAIYVFFMLLSLLLYEKARDRGRTNFALIFISGFIFGCAFLTKQFAGVFLPMIVVWEIIRNRGFKWFGIGHIVFGLAALIVPGPFFAYHLIHNHDMLFKAQSSLSASQYTIVSSNITQYLFLEYLWGLTPPVFIAALAGIIYCIIKRSPGAWLIIVTVIGWNWFLSHWHGHSYYILFLTPFLCLAAGAVIGSFRWRMPAAGLTVLMSAMAAVLSLAMLCSIKYGFNEFSEIVRIAGDQRQKTVILPMEKLYANYHPILRYYGRNTDIIPEKEIVMTGRDFINLGPDYGFLIAGFGREDRDRMPPSTYNVSRPAYGLFLFGYHIFTQMESEHFFNIVNIKIEKLGNFRNNGVLWMGKYASVILGYVPPGYTIPIQNGKIDFNRKSPEESAGDTDQ